MSIHYMEDDWPEPVEPAPRWQYTIGTKWIAVKEIAESLNVQVRLDI